MVFMRDSERAAELANKGGFETGLHINLVLPYDSPGLPESIKKSQNRTVMFFKKGPWTQVIFNPFIVKAAAAAFQSQLEEYRRLFGHEPAHFNGHKHFHLSLNMIFAGILPRGSAVRRSFSFLPGEKVWINRLYRRLVDAWLLKGHFSTDAFYSISPVGNLGRLTRIVGQAKHNHIELMAHPWDAEQYAFLKGGTFGGLLNGVPTGNFKSVCESQVKLTKVNKNAQE